MNMDAVENDLPDRVGTRLASARAARNLSVADIARQLKFSPSQVEALEADRYKQLPDAVFTRGFIRNYARLVGLDPAPLLAAAEPHLPHHPHPQAELPPSTGIPFPTRPPVKWRRYVIAALVLAVPAALFELNRDNDEVTVRVHALPSEPAAPPAEADVAQVSQKKSSPGPVATANAAEAEPTYHLAFVFDKESWVEVRDGHGHRLMWQLNPAGSRQTVNGVPPLSLVVGNADNVHLQLNNRPVDLAAHTEIDVARLTLE